MQRGEVWWARMPAPIRQRPVLLLSRNEAYNKRKSVTIAPITTRIRNFRGEVLVGEADGLRQPSAVNLDDIQTINLSSFLDRAGQLSAAKMIEVEEAIRFTLDLPKYTR